MSLHNSRDNNRFALPLCVAIAFFIALPTQAQFGPDQSASASTLDSIVAVINDDIVTRTELENAVTAARQRISRQGQQPPPEPVLQRQVLERLILQQLQARAAEERGIVIDDPALNAAVESVAQRNNLSLDQLRRVVERDGVPYAEYREQIRQELLANRLRQREIDGGIQVAEQEIDNVLGNAANAREYRIAQILIPIAQEAASPEAVEQAQRRTLEVLSQIRQGADFARLAASVSAGREALEGGELGWLSRTQLPSLFAETVPRLQPGQVSEPIRSPSGFHLVKLLETRGSTPAVDDPNQRRAVREQLFRRKAQEEWELWLRRLRDEAYVEIRI